MQATLRAFPGTSLEENGLDASLRSLGEGAWRLHSLLTSLRLPCSTPDLTGVFDAVERPISDARHWHRPDQDPRLGSGGRGARLPWYRGRRSCVRRSAARRLEADLQRARSV